MVQNGTGPAKLIQDTNRVLITANYDLQNIWNICRSEEYILERKVT
jgi:hypothetical protein